MTINNRNHNNHSKITEKSRTFIQGIDIKRALLLSVSAWLSFTVAYLLGVDNPYWAAMPVWVIAQPTRGVLLERAFYRIAGTLLGSVVGLAILTAFSPAWQLLLMAVAVFISAGSLQLLQGVRSYLGLMAGITVAVVVLPALLSPEQGFDLAWSRILCTLIGVVISTLITGAGTPKSRRMQFYRHVRKLAADTVQASILLLTENSDSSADNLQKKLSIRISDLEAQAMLTAAGSVNGYKRHAYVEALLFASLATLSAAQQLRQQLKRGMQISPEAIEQLRAFGQQLEEGESSRFLSRQDKDNLPNKVSLARLRRALGQMQRAEAALFSEQYPVWRKELPLRTFKPARDWKTARRSAYLCASIVLMAGFMTYFTQSPALELAATGICVFSLLLSSMPKPHIQARYVIVGVSIGALMAGAYRWLLQPYLQDPFWIIIGLFPFVLLGGLARSHPKSEILALDATMCFLLASQFGMPAVPFGEVVQGSLALIFGTAVVCTSYLLLPRHLDSWGRVLLQQTINDIHRVIEQRPPRGISAWRARMARHVMGLWQWMGVQTPKGPIGLINFGYATIAWQRLTASGTACEALGLEVQPVLHDFALFPKRTEQRLLSYAEHVDDALLAERLYEMADALNEARPVLQFLHQPYS